ncbi:MAG: hypothetical protein HOP37_10015 [Cyclobacteriaceae bacterium]|nr:hypothetical protein [Cyclobacteriaceae bacterium]
MKIAIKIIDIHKIKTEEIDNLFGAKPIGELEYIPSELATMLNEIIFEFSYTHKETLPEYLKERNVTGRILQ